MPEITNEECTCRGTNAVAAVHWRQLEASPALRELVEELRRRYMGEFDEMEIDDLGFATKAAEIRGARMAMADVGYYIAARIQDIEASEKEAASAAARAAAEGKVER